MDLEKLKELGISEELAPKVIDLHNGVVTEKESIADKRVKKAFDDVDLAILTNTKVAKVDNEKTTEYAKRAYDTLFETQKTDLDSKIQELQDKLDNHGGDETLKQEIATLKQEKADFQKIKDDAVNEVKTKYDELNGEYTSFKRTSQVKSSLPNNFKKDLDSEFKSYKVKLSIEKALKEYDQVEEKDGKLYLVNSEKFEKKDASEFFKEDLKTLLDEGNSQEGGGAGNKGKETPSELKLSEEMPKGEKIQKIKDFIVAKGISPISNEFSTEYQKLCIEHGLLTKKEDK